MLLIEQRQEILEVSQQLIEDGVIVSGQGNLSYFDRESGFIAITPSAVPYDQRQVEDICVIDIDQNQIEGQWQPTSEIQLHMAYYQQRPDVNAVVHTHAPYATVFGIIGEGEMPMVLNEAAMGLGGPVPVAPYARPGTQELARTTVDATGQGVAVIMAHHGLVTVGKSLQEAYFSTTAAEHTARALFIARSMGSDVSVLSDHEVGALREMFLEYQARPSHQTDDEGT